MGNCASAAKTTHNNHQQIPEDLEKYNPVNGIHLKQMEFQGNLYNIRIHNCNHNQLGLKFKMDKMKDIIIPLNTKENNTNEIKWKQKEKFIFISNEYLLRKNFLEIQVFSNNKEVISTLKINLYLIVTGPYHHDFKIKDGRHQMRLIFDLKLSQMIKFNIQPLSVEIQLDKQYPGEKFNYSFNILQSQNDHTCSSLQSQDVTVPYDKSHSYRRMSQQEQCPSPTKIHKKASKMIKVETTSKISWNIEKNTEMSAFQISISSFQALKATSQYILWKIVPSINKDQQDQERIMFADVYFPFNRFLEEDAVINAKLELQQRNIKFTQTLWNDGVSIGNCSFVIKVTNTVFHKQLQACARTKDGIINMTPLFQTYGSDPSFKGRTIQKLANLQEQILSKNLMLNQLDAFSNQKQVKHAKNQLNLCFDEFFQTLTDTLNESFSLATSEQQNTLFEDQQKLLNICEKIYTFIEDEDINFSEICWKCIILILQRGQFFLRNIGFNDKEKDQITNKKQDSYLRKKLAIALRYKKLIYRILNVSLNFTFSDYRKESKNAAQKFKAYCYIRIPLFRDKILKAVSKSEDQQVNQWKFGDTQKQVNLTESEQFIHLDWETYFESALKKIQNSQAMNKELVESLQDHNWFQTISKRNNQFFFFIRFLIEKFEQLGKKSKFNKWQYLPGYNKLILSFLSQMKKNKISSYSQCLEFASVRLLANQKLINILLVILFEKTNCYQSSDVMRAIDLISGYFTYLTTSKTLLPMTFNYIYFFKALKIILENNFSYSITKALVLIYNFYDNFSVQFRKNITKYLLGKVFFQLFLHWSYSVRTVFHHLLVLRLNVEYSSLKENINGVGDIQSRYFQVLQTVSKTQEIRKSQERELLAIKYQKQLFKIMKRKIALKKKKVKEFQQADSLTPKLKNRRMTISFDTPPVFRPIDCINNRTKQFSKQTDTSDKCIQVQMQKLQLSFSSRKKSDPVSSLTRSNTQLESELQRITKLQRSDQYGKRVRKFSFCGEDDFLLKQIESHEKDYLCRAVDQFKQIKNCVTKYYDENKKMPKIDLGLQLALDQKDIRPSTVDKWKNA